MLAVRLLPPKLDDPEQLIPAAAFAFVGIASTLDAVNLVAGSKKGSNISLKVRNVKDQGENVAAYLVTYILPFVATPLGSWRDWVACGIFFFMLYVVFLRSDLGLVNPTLYLLGWRVFQADVIITGAYGGGTSRATFVARSVPDSEGGTVYARRMVGGYRLSQASRG
jgi:hypothetical protein